MDKNKKGGKKKIVKSSRRKLAIDSSDESSSSDSDASEEETVMNCLREYEGTYETIMAKIFKKQGCMTLNHLRFQIDANKARAQYIRASGDRSPDEDTMMCIWMHAICTRHAEVNGLVDAAWEKRSGLKRFYEKKWLPRYVVDVPASPTPKAVKRSKQTRAKKGKKKASALIETSDEEESEEEEESDKDSRAPPGAPDDTGSSSSYEEMLLINAAIEAEDMEKQRQATVTHMQKQQPMPPTDDEDEEDALMQPAKKKPKRKERDALQKSLIDRYDIGLDSDGDDNLAADADAPKTRLLTVHEVLVSNKMDKLKNLSRTAEAYMSTAYEFMMQKEPTTFPYRAILSRTHRWDFNTYEYEEKLDTGATPVEDLIKDCVFKALMSWAKKVQIAGGTDLPMAVEGAPPVPVTTSATNSVQPPASAPVAYQPMQQQPPQAQQQQRQAPPAVVPGFNMPTGAAYRQQQQPPVGQGIIGNPGGGLEEDRVFWSKVLNDCNVNAVIARNLTERRGGQGGVTDMEVDEIFKHIRMQCGRGMTYKADRALDARGWKIYTSADLQEMQNVVSTTMAAEGYPM